MMLLDFFLQTYNEHRRTVRRPWRSRRHQQWKEYVLFPYRNLHRDNEVVTSAPSNVHGSSVEEARAVTKPHGEAHVVEQDIAPRPMILVCGVGAVIKLITLEKRGCSIDSHCSERTDLHQLPLAIVSLTPWYA